MTRLPTLHARKVVKALEQVGFVLRRQRGSHYIMTQPETKRETVIPVHGRDVNRSLLKLIIKQAGLTEDQFRELL